jgi:hypothetical protein
VWVCRVHHPRQLHRLLRLNVLEIKMPSKSKKQQRFFQLVKAVQEGKAEGSAKAKEVAESMSPESVSHYAKLEKASNANMQNLLNYAGISALIGTGAAGAYGLSRYLYDKYSLPDDIGKLQKNIEMATGSGNYEEEDVDEEDSDEALMLSDESNEPSGVSLENRKRIASRKAAAFKLKDFIDSKTYSEAPLYGFGTPLAMIAPAMLTFHFGKKFLDRKRNNKLDEKVVEAKEEFEQALSEKTSALQQDIDSLYPVVKQAGLFDLPTWTGLRDDVDRLPASIGGPARIVHPDGTIESIYGPSAGPSGLTWLIGATAGLSGVGGYLLLKKKLEEEAERKKVKALKNMLNKDLASSAFQSGLKVVEGPDGKKNVDI